MIKKYINYLPFVGIGIVYIAGAFLDVMDIDASQYAAMSKEMMETGEYLQVKERSQDYLDKPPLLFWVSALFFKLFGVSNFVFRIVPIIASFIGFYATYRLGKLYYNTRIGYLAALVLASCQAMFLMNHDIRTDTMLTAATIFAIWQIAEFNEYKKWLNLILGFVGIGIAMLAKGPIGLMVPVLAFSVHFILKRSWASFFRWQWLVGLVIVALMLLPMSIGLYMQFDANPAYANHPDKSSGLYFYFWKQSFGRLTGENTFASNDAQNPPIYFLAQNFLWSFLPWVLIFVPALFQNIRQLFRQKFKISNNNKHKQLPEGITTGGFVLPFLALSLSSYQLPHYTFVVFPLAAIIQARYLHKVLYEPAYRSKWMRVNMGLQIFTIIILWALAIILSTWAFPLQNILTWGVAIAALAVSVYFLITRKNAFQALIMPSLMTIMGVNFLMNAHVYRNLFEYQTGSVISKYVAQTREIKLNRFYVFGQDLHFGSLDFYRSGFTKDLVNSKDLLDLAKEGTCWIYTNEKGLAEIKNLRQKTTVIKKLKKFPVSMITLPFLNPELRDKEVTKVFLVKFSLTK
ncbi:glycosyltransferase family 39 protein [Microscilla marina]|uniref:Dolichyl-phosphate-mannose-protein mannosyltransferase n=1 Tax=Microscilla marina ATCC 23134 TaxID=313606 RepID=A1ZLR0_MICM2|nr:glycosyltransferase family 39 protein [Microscilla marina]EAY28814.1 dolichyl-phosphate-mannose-protein mannosyltransferase [Microscilla marina ATCC 23134]